jgi:hypothetical protein
VSSVNDLQGHRALQMHINGFIGDSHRAVSEFDRCSIGVLKNLVMLESKLRACRMTLRLERAVQRTNGTEFAIAVQQRIANRASSFVCGFHSPSRASRPRSFRGQLERILQRTLQAGNPGVQFDCNARPAFQSFGASSAKSLSYRGSCRSGSQCGSRFRSP